MPKKKAAGAQGIEARFFGHFQIIYNGEAITESSSRTRRPWILLQYLMVNRNKAVTRQQLIEVLWPDGESDQPEKALKNLVYRVRALFSAANIPFAQDTIVYNNNTYMLNNKLDWALDFEQFEDLYNKAADTARPAGERIGCYRNAIALYHGDFLGEHLYEDWVLPYNTYYRTLFFKCVEQMLVLLEREELFEEMEAVCNHALTFDRFEEQFHLAYMKALVGQNKKAAAVSHYHHLSDMFFKELGVTPCDELRELYKQLSQVAGQVQTDLSAIKEAMREDEVTNDAFLCDFDTFRNLYRLEARSAERAGESVFIGLLTLADEDGSLPRAEVLSKAMSLLLEAAHASLRRGDVISRLSPSQYILMLPTITVENGELVMERILDRFFSRSPYRSLRLDGRLQPLDPA